MSISILNIIIIGVHNFDMWEFKLQVMNEYILLVTKINVIVVAIVISKKKMYIV